MPRRERSLEGVLRAAEDVLRANRVDHVFVGGVTVLAFGMPRTTTDVDVIAVIDARKIPKIVTGFQRAGFFASAQDMHDALVGSTYRIDLVPSSTAAHRETLKTKRRIAWRGRRLPMAAPEHTIVMKLRWGSDQDLEDALAIYLRQKEELDVRTMKAFARRQGVSRELEDLTERASNLS